MLITVQLLEHSPAVFAKTIYEQNMGIPMYGRKTITHIVITLHNYLFPLERFALEVVLGVIVDTSFSSNADAHSGDRPSTTSGRRDQDIPDWLQPFTEGLVEGDLGSSGSASYFISKTPLPHVPATPRRDPMSNTIQFIHFPKKPDCDIC